MTISTTAAGAASRSQRLEELEAQIENGLAQFIEVGTALQRVRDERLFSPTYSSFDEYVEKRWHIGRRRALQQIAASTIGKILRDGAPDLPLRESWAYELRDLARDVAVEIYRDAVQAHGAKLTAKHIRDIRAKHPSTGKTSDVKVRVHRLAAEARAARASEQVERTRDALDEQLRPLYEALVRAEVAVADVTASGDLLRNGPCMEPTASHLRRAIERLEDGLAEVRTWVGLSR